MNRFLYISLAIMLALLCGVSIYAFKERDKRLRVEGNQETLLSELEITKTDNGNYKTEVGVLQLTNKELKSYKTELADRLENLEIKVGQVTSVSTNLTNTITNVSTVLKDSIIHDTINAQVIDYKSPWLIFYGIIVNDSLEATISSRDSLTQVVYDDRKWVRRVFKFWEKPKLKQAISSSNPNCKIEYSEFIKLTNKRGK